MAADALRPAIHAANDTLPNDAPEVSEAHRSIGEVNFVVDRLLRLLAGNVDRLAAIDELATDDSTTATALDNDPGTVASIGRVAIELATIGSGRRTKPVPLVQLIRAPPSLRCQGVLFTRCVVSVYNTGKILSILHIVYGCCPYEAEEEASKWRDEKHQTLSTTE